MMQPGGAGKTGSAQAGFKVVLGNRNFTFLWSAQALSQVAQNIINFAVVVQVENLTHSTTEVALTIVAFILPAVIFSPIAGVLVDRMDKKVILLGTNVLRGVATLGFVVFGHTLLAIFSILFVSSVINQLFSPAESASIPMLVKREQLMNANSLFNITFNGAIFVGFVIIAPAVIKFAGLRVVFFVTVAMYLAAAGLCSVLPARMGRLRPVQTAGEPGSGHPGQMLDEIREGLAYIFARKELVTAIIQLTLIQTLLLIMGEMAPGFTARVLNLTAADTAYVFLPLGLGLILGIITLNRVTRLIPKELLTRISVFAIGLLTFGVGISPPLSRLGAKIASTVSDELQAANWLIALDLFLLLIIGFAFAYVVVPAQTQVQELTEDENRGRVFSIQLMLASAFMIIPLLFFGSLADAFGITQVLAGMGILIAIPFGFTLRHAVREYHEGRYRQSA
ncbi:MAG TPA: MFS transporter [Chloroflexota bacterium]|nr:MFS transporter [Chloroflexota bacterium]